MPSTPLIASSMGVATVSAITFGLAPGYCARTTTEGGATSGYSEIGITRSASNPARKISTDSTPAKIGRSIKNLERFMAAPVGPFELLLAEHGLRRVPHLAHRLSVHRHGFRRHQCTGPHALQSVDDDALAGCQAARHDAQAVDECPERHLAVGRDVALVDHDHELLVLIG